MKIVLSEKFSLGDFHMRELTIEIADSDLNNPKLAEDIFAARNLASAGLQAELYVYGKLDPESSRKIKERTDAVQQAAVKAAKDRLAGK